MSRHVFDRIFDISSVFQTRSAISGAAVPSAEWLRLWGCFATLGCRSTSHLFENTAHSSYLGLFTPLLPGFSQNNGMLVGELSFSNTMLDGDNSFPILLVESEVVDK
jgi:hypothetical protein